MRFWLTRKHMAETRQKAYAALLNASSNPDRVLMLRNTCYLLKHITKLQFTVYHYEDSDSDYQMQNPVIALMSNI